MPKKCSICTHAERDKIDRALVSGASCRKIKDEFGVSESAVYRHSKAHVSPALAAMQAQREEQGAATLLDRVERLILRTERLLSAAEESGAVTTALAAVREQRELLRLLGAASGELSTTPTVTINLLQHPEGQTAIQIVMAETAAYPELRQRIAERLQLEAGTAP